MNGSILQYFRKALLDLRAEMPVKLSLGPPAVLQGALNTTKVFKAPCYPIGAAEQIP
jgi:hypothetical protein